MISPAVLETLPKDVCENVLCPMLNLGDLAALSLTSRMMRIKVRAIVDLAWEMRRAEMTIGPELWESVGFKVKEIPPLPEDINQILKAPCRYFRGKRVYQTQKLILMPRRLSINFVDTFRCHLQHRLFQTVFFYLRQTRDVIEMDRKEVQDSYWALVTTEVIPGSRGVNVATQQSLINKVGGYAFPSLLEAITLATMHKGYSLGKNICCDTICAESIRNHRTVLTHDSISRLSVHILYDDPCGRIGVLAARNLNVRSSAIEILLFVLTLGNFGRW